MSDIDRYISAATRDNTRRAYRSAVNHFEIEWGGFLPATSDMVARYLTDHANTLSTNTLKLRLSALSQWHIDQGMPDPTKAPLVKKVMRGIKALHPAQEKQAKPLQLIELEQTVNWLDQKLAEAIDSGNQTAVVKHSRDRAILLLGFWQGFRSDELSRLEIQFLTLNINEGLEIFLPVSKGDRDYRGKTFKVPTLHHLCPVQAVDAWISVSGATHGALFRSIDRWGNISKAPLHPGSFISLVKTLLAAAGVADADHYSSHSLRRGFTTWATHNHWDLKSLMQYVGWKDVRSAMRYLPVNNPFSQLKLTKLSSNHQISKT